MYSLGLVFLEMSAIFWGIGRDLQGVTIGIVNEEAGDCNDGRNIGHVTSHSINESCQLINISCRFLDSFDYYIEKVSCILGFFFFVIPG